MSGVNEKIERLIVRRLDGELTEDEQLELDRELLRSPEARRLLEDYQRIDSDAAAVLAEVLPDSQTVPEVRLAAPSRSYRGYGRFWWVMPAAVAAAVALAVVLTEPGPSRPQLASQPATAPVKQVQPVSPHRYDDSGVYRASYGTNNLSRSVDQNRLYIMGPDGNLYVVDQRHTRTARQPIRTRGPAGPSGAL